MRKILMSLICCLMVFGIGGCSKSNKEQLTEKFQNKKDSIANLSDKDAEEYLNCLKENTSYSFNDIEEFVFYKTSIIPDDITRILKNLRDSSERASIKWSMENFTIKNGSKDNRGIFYDLYWESKDTNIDISMLYDPLNNKMSGAILSSNGKFDYMDSKEILTMMTLFVTCVDETTVNDTINISKKIMLSASEDKPFVYNDWIYSLSINESVNFLAAPVK